MMTPKAEDPSEGERRSLLRIFWPIAVLVFVADQLSKWIIVHSSGFSLGVYPPHGGMEIIPGFFNLVYAVNYGAAWGMLEGFSIVLILLAVLVLGLLALFRNQLELHLPLHQLCFGLITGGILGNTLDRLFRGHVVDFLDVLLPFYRWPTFNIADSAIVVGTGLYLLLSFRQADKKEA
jgi:signal peptidase II